MVCSGIIGRKGDGSAKAKRQGGRGGEPRWSVRWPKPVVRGGRKREKGGRG